MRIFKIFDFIIYIKPIGVVGLISSNTTLLIMSGSLNAGQPSKQSDKSSKMIFVLGIRC